MRFKTLATAAAAGVLTVSTGCASNSTPPASVPAARSELGFVPNRLSAGTFREFDRDGNGYLSKDEARGALLTYFEDLDRTATASFRPRSSA
jgi:hypothetical protein